MMDRQQGVAAVVQALSGHPDLESVLIDGAIVPVHQKATGTKEGLSISPLADPAAG